MIVAATTECFPDASLPSALERLVDLEYTSVEVALHEKLPQLRPSLVAAEFEKAVAVCRQTRLSIVSFSVDIAATGETYYEQFQACCRLAKATKVVTLTVPAAELGTPFNEEIERLRRLAAIATAEGVIVGLKTQMGCLTENPETAVVLCDQVKNLGLTYDPSAYVFGPGRNAKQRNLMKHVVNVHLRDTSKDNFQVRIGQGEIEYGRIITDLQKLHYRRALVANIVPMPDVDQAGELRKIRLLLESLL